MWKSRTGKLIAIAILGVVTGIVILQNRTTVNQQDIASLIRKNGGNARWSGASIVGVYCNSDTKMPMILEALKQLPDCKSLTLWPYSLNNDSITALAALAQIRTIELTAPLGVYFGVGPTDVAELMRQRMPDKEITCSLYSRSGSF